MKHRNTENKNTLDQLKKMGSLTPLTEDQQLSTVGGVAGTIGGGVQSQIDARVNVL